MSTRQDTARLLFGGVESATRRTVALGSSSVRRGTAQSDSSGGKVSVLLDGSTQAVDLRCILPVKKGQRGTIVYQGGTYTFIALEQLTEDAKNNSKAIEEAEEALKEAQDDLKELDVKLYGEDGKSGAMAELKTKLGELDESLAGLDDDLHGEGGLDESLAELNADLYGDGTEENPGKLAELDADLDGLNTKLYGDGTEENPGKLAELDADLDPDNEKGAMGKAVAEAKAALADAKTAQETADGKNRVVVQADQPTGTFAKGDLWRKLDGDGNITGEYVWNGGAWAKHVLTADALLVKSIVAATAFIEALQAKKLTANEVDAASIVTKAVISAAVSTDKLTANEVDAASIVTRSLLTSLLKANKITANEIGSGVVTTNHLGAKAVTAAKVDVEELVASEAFIDQFAANTAIIEQIYAAAVVAKEITASKLKVAGDGSYAEVANGILKLFNSGSSSLTELAASYADFCAGQFRIDVGDGYTRMKNAGLFTKTIIDPGGTLEVASNARIPGITVSPSPSARLNLTSSMQVVPMSWKQSGWAGNPSYLAYANSGVVVAARANASVSGFAMFRGVSAGERCVLALYYGETQLAYVITTSQGGYCAVSIGPVMFDGGGEGSSRLTLRARTGDGTGFIGYDSGDGTREAHLTAALTVSC